MPLPDSVKRAAKLIRVMAPDGEYVIGNAVEAKENVSDKNDERMIECINQIRALATLISISFDKMAEVTKTIENSLVVVKEAIEKTEQTRFIKPIYKEVHGRPMLIGAERVSSLESKLNARSAKKEN